MTDRTDTMRRPSRRRLMVGPPMAMRRRAALLARPRPDGWERDAARPAWRAD